MPLIPVEEAERLKPQAQRQAQRATQQARRLDPAPVPSRLTGREDAFSRSASGTDPTGLLPDELYRTLTTPSTSEYRDYFESVDRQPRAFIPHPAIASQYAPLQYEDVGVSATPYSPGLDRLGQDFGAILGGGENLGNYLSNTFFAGVPGFEGQRNSGTRIREAIESIPGVGRIGGTAFDVGAAPTTMLAAGAFPALSRALPRTGPGMGTARALLEPLTSGGFGSNLAAETALGTGFSIGAEELTERGVPAPLALAGGLAAGAAVLAGARGAAAGVRAVDDDLARQAIRQAEGPLERSFSQAAVAAVPTDSGVRRVRTVAGAASPVDTARTKLIDALTEERRLRRTGIATREIREGRRQQAAAIREARASGLSGEELLKAEARAAKTGTLRQTFPKLELDDAEFDSLLDALNAAPPEIVGDFDALSLGRALSDWRRGTRPPQPKQIQAIGRVLGGEVQGLADDLAKEAREYAQDQGLIRKGRELLEGLQARQRATAIRQQERTAGQAIDRRIRELGDLSDLTPPPRPSDDAFRLSALDPKQNKGSAAAIRRSKAQVEAWRKGQMRVASEQAKEAQRQLNIIRQMEELNARAVSRQADTEVRQAARAARGEASETAAVARANARESRIVQQARRAYPTEDEVLRRVDRAVSVKAPEAAEQAKEVTRVWLEGNRSILDRIEQSDNVSVARWVEASVRGDVPDPFLNGVLVRESLLVSELSRAGIDPTDAKSIARKLTQRELMLRANVSNPQMIPEAWTNTLRNARTVKWESALGGAVTANQRAKSMMFGLADIGIFGQQLLAAIQNGGIPAVVGFANRLMALAHLPHMQTLMADVNLPKQAQYALDGVSMNIASSGLTPEAGTLLSYLGPVGRRVDDFITPIVDAWSRFQFDTILGNFRQLTYEGDLVMARLLGDDIADPLVRWRAAQNANHINSFANTATRATRRQVESLVFTSSPMNRARVARIADVAKLITPGASKQERLYAATMVASQVMVGMLAGKFMHDQFGVGEFEWDPSKPGYGRFTTVFKDAQGRNIVWDYMPQDSIQRAFLQSLRALSEGDPAEALTAWTRAGIGSVSPAMRPFATGLGFGFDPESGYRIFEYPDDGAGALAEFAPIPPIFSEMMRGNTDPRYLATEFAAVQTFPESAYGLKDRLARDQYGKPYKELEPFQRAEIDRLPDVQQSDTIEREEGVEQGDPYALADQASVQRFEQQTLDDVAVQEDRMTWDEWKSNRNQRNAYLRGALDAYFAGSPDRRDPSDPLRQFSEQIEQHTGPNGMVDWDRVFAWVEEQPTDTQDYIERNTGLNRTPLEQERARVASELEDEGYFDIRDRVWQRIAERSGITQTDVGEFQADLRARIRERLIERGVTDPSTQRILTEQIMAEFPALTAWRDVSNEVEEAWITSNPTLANRAYAMGYITSLRKDEERAVIGAASDVP